MGEHWSQRWIETHPQFKVIKDKSIESECQQAMDRITIRKFFNEEFKPAIDKYGIESVDIWNMDETGLRVGVGRGQWVIVPADLDDKNSFARLISSLGDTEHITVIESISGDGIAIDSLIIIKGAIIQARWFADLASGDIAIGVSETGYSNDELGFLWLQHWDQLSHRHQKGRY